MLTPASVLAAGIALASAAEPAPSAVPAPLRDLTFTPPRAATVWLGGPWRVHVTVSTQQSLGADGEAYAQRVLVDAVSISWGIATSIIQASDKRVVDCRGEGRDVHIFLVSPDDFNAPGRFDLSAFGSVDDPARPVTLYGLFDPAPEAELDTAIMMWCRSTDQFMRVILHELAHYWWDRLCLVDVLRQYTTESFASKVEEWWDL
jgi:hypothetical protein